MRKLLLLSAVVVVFAVPALAATFTVTTNADSGAGSLREAIMNANAGAGADTIAFAIGSGVQTIQLASPLPAITDALTIDGTTQPGYSGTPVITVRGTGSGAGFTEAFLLQATTTVRALALRNFNGGFTGGSNGNVIEANDVTLELATGIGVFFTGSNNQILDNTLTLTRGAGVLLTASNNTVQGNDITGNRTGGVSIAASGSNNLIGGTAAGQGNEIASDANPVVLEGLSNTIQGNEISFGDPTGVVYITGSNNTIGGSTAGAGNTIWTGLGFGRSGAAIHIAGNNNFIGGNRIGIDTSGAYASNNALRITGEMNVIGGSGAAENSIAGYVMLQDASRNTFEGNTIGVDLHGTVFGHLEIRLGSNDNMLRNNTLYATVTVTDTSTGNAIVSGNTFLPPSEGIQLMPVQPNDPGDADSGPNLYQNHPVITTAMDAPGGSTITGTLNSTPSRVFLLEFYTGSTCGESLPIGTLQVSTDASGNAPFVFNTSMHTNVVTATATSLLGNNTSMMAPCVTTQGSGSVAIGDATVNESATQAMFTITLSPSQSQPVSVSVDTLPGTATNGADYQRVTTNVTFAPGETSKQVHVPIVRISSMKPTRRSPSRSRRSPATSRSRTARDSARFSTTTPCCSRSATSVHRRPRGMCTSPSRRARRAARRSRSTTPSPRIQRRPARTSSRAAAPRHSRRARRAKTSPSRFCRTRSPKVSRRSS